MFLSDRKLATISRRTVWLGIFLSAAFLINQSGCVQRRMTIRSNPPGALVYVDDYEIGATPISTNFTYYGNRKIRLVKDGYETLTVLQPIPAPWYQYPPFDFITENFVPGQIRDQRTIDFQLKPQMVVPADQLLNRAESMRRNNFVMPTGGTTSRPGGSGPYLQPGTAAPPATDQFNQYPQQNVYPQPNVNQPPQGIGGQGIYQLPPR
jgi:hypothetical protein